MDAANTQNKRCTLTLEPAKPVILPSKSRLSGQQSCDSNILLKITNDIESLTFFHIINNVISLLLKLYCLIYHN